MGYWAKDGSYVYDEHDVPSERHEHSKFYPTGEAGSGSIYDASEDVLKGFEKMIQGQKKEDLPNQQIADKIIQSLPLTSEELKSELEKINYRLDLVKRIVEAYRDKFFTVYKKYEKDYSQNASNMINAALTEYLCLLETLKSGGYQYGKIESKINKGYDAYEPDMMIYEVIDAMHKRRKEGADIEITFPVDYDYTVEDQPKADAVTITDLVQKHQQDNPYMDMLWEKAGYEKREEKTM